MKGEDYGKRHKVKRASSLVKGDVIQPDVPSVREG